MSTESQNVRELFESWILDAETKLNETDLVSEMKKYLVSQHPEICGKCTPCRDGVVRMEKLLDDISYNASDRGGETFTITASYVKEQVSELAEDADLSKFIL